MTEDEMARAIRLAERAYFRVFSQRNPSPTWLSDIVEASTRLGQLRLESWKFMQRSETDEHTLQESNTPELNHHDNPSVRIGSKPKRATPARMVLARTAHRGVRVHP